MTLDYLLALVIAVLNWSLFALVYNNNRTWVTYSVLSAAALLSFCMLVLQWDR